MSKNVYDESKVQTLSALEHIRKRTGMYIGRIGDGTHYDDGLYILFKEVVDNAIDEFIMGHGKKVDITLDNHTMTVRDYGRGIPLGKVIECVSKINTGAKYNDDVFQFSVGLNGVGTKAVNALSESFVVRSYREGKFVQGTFTRGELLKENKGNENKEPNGTFVSFTPDTEIFKSAAFNLDLLKKRIEMYTYLNAGLKFIFNGEEFSSEDGLYDLIYEDTGVRRYTSRFISKGNTWSLPLPTRNDLMKPGSPSSTANSPAMAAPT